MTVGTATLHYAFRFHTHLRFNLYLYNEKEETQKAFYFLLLNPGEKRNFFV